MNFLDIPANQQKSCRYFLLYTYYCENVTQQRYCYRKKVMMRTIQVLVVATVINLIASSGFGTDGHPGVFEAIPVSNTGFLASSLVSRTNLWKLYDERVQN